MNSYRSLRAASLGVMTMLALGGLGCAASLVPKPPAPEDEVARLKREITKVRFAVASQ